MKVTKESARTLIKLIPISSRHYVTVKTIGEGDLEEKDIIDLSPRDLDDMKIVKVI
jgi:hypothetical protein